MPARVKVGILNDMADLAEPDDAVPMPGDLSGWLEREIGAVRAAGRLDAEVEFLHAYALGLPSGTAEAVEQAYRGLVDGGAVLVVGPGIADNAMVAAPLAEQLRVPTLNWSGAERARSRWMFQHQVGSHEDESLVIARQMADLGKRRIAVVHDISPIGTRHLKYLEDEARLLGLEIVGHEGLSPLADDARDPVARLLEADPDAFVYLGLGLSAPAMARALSHAGWDGARMMNSAGLRGYHGDFARTCDGWFYIDMHSDANATLGALMAGMTTPRSQALSVARGHDIGRLVAEGLARAGDLTRDGVRLGLERVKWLPAAQGHDGTLLGFGICDRGALHGRYLVVRQWQGGETLEVTSKAHTRH